MIYQIPMRFSSTIGGTASAVAPTVPPGAPPARRTGLVIAVAIIVVLAAALAGVSIYSVLKPSSPASTSGAISVTDDAGRTVTVPSPAHRLVVLAPSVMDMVYRLGLRADVVGVDCGDAAAGGVLADYTPGQVANWSLSSVPCITWIPSLDLQATVAANPDLVIGVSGISLADLDTLTTTDGIPTLYLNPSTIIGIGYDVTILGELTGTSAAAASIVQQMTQALANDTTLLENATVAPRILLTYYVDPTGYWTFGPDSFGEALIEAAGAVSITANDTLANEEEISGAYVLGANPDAIVVGTGFGYNVSSYSIGPDWSSFGAVTSGHVLGINAIYFTEPDPTMVFGIYLLIELLHPELFGGEAL